jgi:hypothetical protein
MFEAAARGQDIDWVDMLKDFNSGVDYPISSYPEELLAAFPDARFILAERHPADGAGDEVVLAPVLAALLVHGEATALVLDDDVGGGIELLADNIAECRANMLEVLAEYLQLEETDDLNRAAAYVLSQNLVHGDALSMQTHEGKPITFAEWGYLGKGKFQRRDFRYDVLTQTSSYSQEGTLFAHLGKHEIFTPTETYPPMTIHDLAQKGCA